MQKVTAFVMRSSRTEILLFRHENAGIQFPAGSVEPGEEPVAAALRETLEETGIGGAGVRAVTSLGSIEDVLGSGELVTEDDCPLYSRPRVTSFGWARLRRGITVAKLREEGDFVQVDYEEWDDEAARDRISYKLTGWAERRLLSPSKERHFFLLDVEEAREAWEVDVDHHRFSLFWWKVTQPIVMPPLQDGWMNLLRRALGR